jgi:GNAT superfamily N-acetyltransferase
MKKMFQVKTKLERKERRLLKKIDSWKSYKIILYILFSIFSFKKTFLVVSKWVKKVSWIISITVYRVFWKKIWYIDDFIVHKKFRWKWVWKQIFLWATKKLEKEENDYVFLLSRRERKTSHKIYRSVWFKVIGLWIGILAYKKFHKKK